MDSFTVNKEFVDNDYECQKDIEYQIQKFKQMSDEEKEYVLYVLYSCCKIYDSISSTSGNQTIKT